MRNSSSSPSTNAWAGALLGLALLSTSCFAHDFTATEVFEAGQPVFGLASADLEGDAAPECACLLADGSVLIISPGSGWSSRLIHAPGDSSYGMWDRPTLDLGDVHSAHPGDEIVILSHYLLYVLHRGPTDEWAPEIIYDHSGYVGSCWGARVGDYDPSHAGDEVFAIIEGVLDCSVGVIHACTDGVWRDTLVYSAEVGMDSAAGEFNEDHDGPEIILPTEMGFTYEIHLPPFLARDLWPALTIWIDMYHSGWVVEIGDVDIAHAGNEVVYGTRYSNSVLVSSYQGAGQHDLEVAFTGETALDPRNMWDIAVGDFLAEVPGMEVAGVDESGNVYLVWREAGEWHGETIWRSRGSPLYSVAAAEVDPTSDGCELIVSGEDGLLILLTRAATGAPGTDPAAPLIALDRNPVRSEASFALSVAEHGHARLCVYDVAGREVALLVDGPLPAGESPIVWAATDDRGRPLGSGVYFARLETSAGTATRSFVLLR